MYTRSVVVGVWLIVTSSCVMDGSALAASGSSAEGLHAELPLRTVQDAWVYSEVEAAQCRDGSPAGVGVLAECGDACPQPDDHGLDYMAFVARSFADRTSGWMAAAGDKLMRSILGTGEMECSVPLDWANEGIERSRYTGALNALRERLAPYPSFGSFVPDADNHTWLFGYLPGVSGDLYVDRAGGVRAIDWFSDVVRGTARGNLGP